ncbi:hypothetical protein AB0L59_13790 [Streptomyces sp. NPDC052109]|uniref:hypothetical protein n=1 Tax=Streptomyces sp. NPDC052109 TaxID=3155527 RepID=UPI003436C44E
MFGTMGGRLGAVGATAVLLAALAACGGGRTSGTAAPHTGATSGTSSAPSPAPEPVHGLKDTLRHVTRRTTPATRPHLVQRCTTGSHRVRHSSTSGTGSHRRTRTWYTTDHYRDCRKVRSGTETYRKEIRPERWCVRLDHVNGNRKQDDVWFRVDRLDYDRVLDADDHARVQFTPVFPDTGC